MEPSKHHAILTRQQQLVLREYGLWTKDFKINTEALIGANIKGNVNNLSA